MFADSLSQPTSSDQHCAYSHALYSVLYMNRFQNKSTGTQQHRRRERKDTRRYKAILIGTMINTLNGKSNWNHKISSLTVRKQEIVLMCRHIFFYGIQQAALMYEKSSGRRYWVKRKEAGARVFCSTLWWKIQNPHRFLSVFPLDERNLQARKTTNNRI